MTPFDFIDRPLDALNQSDLMLIFDVAELSAPPMRKRLLKTLLRRLNRQPQRDDELLGHAAYALAARSGNKRTAVQIMLGAVGANPRSVAYWTELGNVLFAHDGYQMSPAARFAFRRARTLGPGDPTPFFFEGLAWMRAGDFRKARVFWNRALELSPANAAYRPAIEQRVMLLDQAIRVMGE